MEPPRSTVFHPLGVVVSTAPPAPSHEARHWLIFQPIYPPPMAYTHGINGLFLKTEGKVKTEHGHRLKFPSLQGYRLDAPENLDREPSRRESSPPGGGWVSLPKTTPIQVNKEATQCTQSAHDKPKTPMNAA